MDKIEKIVNKPIPDIPEQLELPVVGLSKENREKVNIKVWIVGAENSPLHNLMREQGYQVRGFFGGGFG